MDLTATLLAAQSPDLNVRTQAEQQLNTFELSDLPNYLLALCRELGDPAKTSQTRQLAGIQLKNAIFSKDATRNAELTQRWLMVNDAVRLQIKHGILSTLASPVRESRSTAALVVGKLAAIEVPKKMWEDLVQLLLHNITAAPTKDLKQSTFEALGYVCEEVPESLSAHSNGILSAVASGMSAEETDANVKLAATNALTNSLLFIKDNMAVENDRRLIVQMIGTAAQFSDERVRVSAYQCLCDFADQYYEYLEPFMNDLFMLTGNAIKTECEAVALQALEFWTRIGEMESELVADEQDAQEKGRQPDQRCFKIVHRALLPLLPLILDCLMLQSDDPDDENTTKASAASCCLVELSRTVGDDIIGTGSPVLPFIESRIQSKNWREREAATMAFGSILEGPGLETVSRIVSTAFGLILTQVQDDHPIVKETAIWTVAKICDICPETISEQHLPHVMRAVEIGLRDSPKIAALTCYAIHNLAAASDVDEDTQTCLLSPYFQGLVQLLWTTTERADAGENNLTDSAYNALSMLVQQATQDSLPCITAMLPGLLDRLRNTIVQAIQATAAHSDAASKFVRQQALICGVLQHMLRKLPESVVQGQADNIMMMILEALKGQTASVHEESLMVVSALANKIGADFAKYMPVFQPYLLQGLRAFNEAHLCIGAIGVVSDLLVSLGDKMLPMCNDIVQALITNLQNPSTHRSVKPIAISCFGDLAMAIQGSFEVYLPYVMMMLVGASQARAPSSSSGDVDYINSLRVSVLEAYTGIILGLTDGGKGMLFIQFLDSLLGMLDIVANDPDTDSDVLDKAIGVIGDVAENIKAPAVGEKLRAKQATLQKLIQLGQDDEMCQDSASRALNCLKQL